MGNTRSQHTTLLHRLICIDNRSHAAIYTETSCLWGSCTYLEKYFPHGYASAYLILNASTCHSTRLFSLLSAGATTNYHWLNLPLFARVYQPTHMRHKSRKFTVFCKHDGLISVLPVLLIKEHVPPRERTHSLHRKTIWKNHPKFALTLPRMQEFWFEFCRALPCWDI